jgi:putative hydrolase of the HAD superfamily
MDVRWLIFDAMGVIYPVGDDTNDLLVPFVRARNPAMASAEINALYMEAILGHIRSEVFWQRCRIPEPRPDDLEFEYLDSCFEIDSSFIAAAKTLKSRGYGLAMLSNDVSEWSAFLRNKFALNDLLDASFISGDIGIRKPDKRIYRYALDRLRAAPESCLFIDDREKNLLPANEMGMHIIRFSRESADKKTLSPMQEITSFGDLLRIL